MSLPIFWTSKAKDDYAYLLNEIEKTETVVDTIERYPSSFQTFEYDTRARRAVITKQTSLIYQVTKINSRLMYFWDNRKGEPV